MINFRYHVVTLVAVFLAMGLGVLFGASFVDQSVVDALRRAQNRIENRSAELRRDVLALERKNKSLEQFVESGEPFLVEGALQDRPLILLSFESTDEDLPGQVGATLVRAGAKVEASVRLSDKLDLGSDERKRQAAVAVDADPGQSIDEVSALVAQQLAASMSATSPGFLQRLLDAQLAAPLDLVGAAPKPLPTLAAEGTGVVIIAPGPERRALHERFVVPVLKALADAGVVTAVTEPGTEIPLLKIVRDQDLKVVTVDGIETPGGRSFLALGMRAAFAGRFGDYGHGEDASAAFPEPAP